MIFKFDHFREQLLHKLKLDEKEYEEKLTRERAGKVAELHVSTAEGIIVIIIL